jgi:hypothetical protein
MIAGAVRVAALLTAAWPWCSRARSTHLCGRSVCRGEVIALVHARDSDDDQGSKPGHGKAKVAATALALGLPVVRDFTQIVTEVLNWFT